MGAPRFQSAGSIHAAISDALDAARRTSVREELGFDLATLSHWCDPAEGNGRRMPVVALDQVARLSPAAAEVIARHFAALAGAELRPAPAPAVSLSGSVAALSLAAAEVSADMIRATDPAGPGGAAITESERRRLQADLDAASSALAVARNLLVREGRP